MLAEPGHGEERSGHPGREHDVLDQPALLSGEASESARCSIGNGLAVLQGVETGLDLVERPLTSRAGDGNRTRTTSLEGWSSTIELRPRVREA